MERSYLLCHTRRSHDGFSVHPGDEEGVIGHGASPGQTSPADGDGRDNLGDDIVGGASRDLVRHGDAEDDALVVDELGEVKASLDIDEGGRVRLSKD